MHSRSRLSVTRVEGSRELGQPCLTLFMQGHSRALPDVFQSACPFMSPIPRLGLQLCTTTRSRKELTHKNQTGYTEDNIHGSPAFSMPLGPGCSSHVTVHSSWQAWDSLWMYIAQTATHIRHIPQQYPSSTPRHTTNFGHQPKPQAERTKTEGAHQDEGV